LNTVAPINQRKSARQGRGKVLIQQLPEEFTRPTTPDVLEEGYTHGTSLTSSLV
jgi:hypothetical protein